jgi:hypothetical protein
MTELEAFEDWVEELHSQASSELMTMNLEQQHIFHSIYNDITNSNETEQPCKPVFIEG